MSRFSIPFWRLCGTGYLNSLLFTAINITLALAFGQSHFSLSFAMLVDGLDTSMRLLWCCF